MLTEQWILVNHYWNRQNLSDKTHQPPPHKPDMSPGSLTSIGHKLTPSNSSWAETVPPYCTACLIYVLSNTVWVWYISFLTPDSWLKERSSRNVCWVGGVGFLAQWWNWIIKFDYWAQMNLHVHIVIMSIKMTTDQLFPSWTPVWRSTFKSLAGCDRTAN